MHWSLVHVLSIPKLANNNNNIHVFLIVRSHIEYCSWLEARIVEYTCSCPSSESVRNYWSDINHLY